ncbi:MAG: ribose-phosphate diphosphokinase [bacterium]|nr:ribose-phosphate diphosphokinase [bacterium]
MQTEMQLCHGSANGDLANAVGRVLEAQLGHTAMYDGIVSRIGSPFNDGEPRVQIIGNARGRSIYIVQSTHQPGDNFMELAAMVNAANLASAGRIIAVIPYFGYARQDKKVLPRTPITAAVVCTMLEALGVHHIMTTDLHAGQIQGMFRGPFDNLKALPVVLRQVVRDLGITREQMPRDVALVSPDDNGAERCRETGEVVGCGLVTFYMKGRDHDGHLIAGGVIRDPALVAGRTVLLIDDMIATGGTMKQAAIACKEAGAQRVIVIAVHPVFSTDTETGMSAYELLADAPIEYCYCTDTIPFSEERCRWTNSQKSAGAHRDPNRAVTAFRQLAARTTIVPISKLFADAISEVQTRGSVSAIFRRTCEAIFS